MEATRTPQASEGTAQDLLPQTREVWIEWKGKRYRFVTRPWTLDEQARVSDMATTIVRLPGGRVQTKYDTRLATVEALRCQIVEGPPGWSGDMLPRVDANFVAELVRQGGIETPVEFGAVTEDDAGE